MSRRLVSFFAVLDLGL